MEHIFIVTDSSGRKIRLSKEQWRHIAQEHPEVVPYLEEIKETLGSPITITTFYYDNKIKYFYKYLKYRASPYKYLLIIVKYLNGEGFIVTAYFVRAISK